MEQVFGSRDRVGDIVARFPEASSLFMSYKIDFCCGGNRPLSVAVEEKGLNIQEILEALNELYKAQGLLQSDNTNWNHKSALNLIDYVVSTHHVFLKENLSKISDLLFMILLVHSDHHPELYRVHGLYNDLRKELEAHLVKEETILFPLIKIYEADISGGPSKEDVMAVIDEIEDEHTAAGDILKELRKITSDYEPPDDGCGTYEITYRKLAELEENTFQHIHLENNILFHKL